jgi:hypothetical protein
LRELVARQQASSAEDLAPFTSPHALPRLKALDLSHNHFRRDGLRHLLDAPCLAELERLSLCDCELRGPDGGLLAEASWRTTLTALDLSCNCLEAAGLRRVLAADWPRLRLLRLVSTWLRGPARAVLTRWPGLARLGALDLSGHEIGADLADHLSRAGLSAEARLVEEPALILPHTLSELAGW